MTRQRMFLIGSVLVASALTLTPARARANSGSYIGQFSTINTVASTVPANGDVNPYGVAVAPRSVGSLVRGNILVSNFNASSNLQGTGTTIVQIAPNGATSLFARIDTSSLHGRPCPGGIGLTTALVVLKSGWVIVGSLPTADGMFDTAQAGCLLVLNSSGQLEETIAGPLINGPWDMTALDLGSAAFLFVSNVLNGTVAASPNVVNRGTVVRILLALVPDRAPIPVAWTVIGSGFSERTDPNAVVVGPTGLGLGFDGTLYVADSVNNRIAAIPNAIRRWTSAGSGFDVTANGAINDPLGLTIAPNGDILTVNGNDGNIVETTPQGSQIGTFLLDNTGGTGAGCLFGLTVAPGGNGVYFVDDCQNALNILH